MMNGNNFYSHTRKGKLVGFGITLDFILVAILNYGCLITRYYNIGLFLSSGF